MLASSSLPFSSHQLLPYLPSSLPSPLPGKIVPNPSPPDTICDALLTTIKELPWAVIKELVDGVVTVTDDEVITSMKYIMERMKVPN